MFRLTEGGRMSDRDELAAWQRQIREVFDVPAAEAFDRLCDRLLAARTPGPATAKLIRCIKADLEPSDKMIDAFLAEHGESKG